MQFSDKTLKILENFSDINPSILLEEGNEIYTIAPNKTIFAKATTDDNIEGEAGIYILKSFLKILGLFKDPEVDFGENRFTISDDRQKVNYTYAAKNMIMVPTSKNIKMPAPDVKLNLKWEDFDATITAAGVLGMEHIAIVGSDGKVDLQVYDPKNPTSDKYSITLEDDVDFDEDFKVLIKLSNLKLMNDNYEVSIAVDKLVMFKSDFIEYYVALEKE